MEARSELKNIRRDQIAAVREQRRARLAPSARSATRPSTAASQGATAPVAGCFGGRPSFRPNDPSKPAATLESKRAIFPRRSPPPSLRRIPPSRRPAQPSSICGKHPADECPAAAAARRLPLITGIRHWSTPDYTRVAIDLQQEVRYQAARVSDPDRIFFDLYGARLSPELSGRAVEVTDDGFLTQIRAAQSRRTSPGSFWM